MQAGQTIVGTLTTEKLREGQEKGRKAQSHSAAEIREMWFKEAVNLVVAGYESGLLPGRAKIIDGLRMLNLSRGILGKRGQQLKRDTISRWLTDYGYRAIYYAAMKYLIKEKSDNPHSST